jgi:hypothetical protein|tara:strand:- start:251 stop:469 length:219 start_codon:yes stop_codon:yes gene_type:complete
MSEAIMIVTSFCMLPVSNLDSAKIGDGKVGKIYKKLLKSCGVENQTDIVEQIKNWDKKTKSTNNKLTLYTFK